ncbi:MAG: TonB-dependent receptor [Pseudomonadota bacterium]
MKHRSSRARPAAPRGRRIGPLALAAGLAAVSSASLQAHTVALPEVTVSETHENTVGTSDAASQGVVTAEQIAIRPMLRTGDILEFVPGLIVSQHSGDGKANQYYLRGFNLDHGTDFATYVDGMPVNMRSHAHGQGYTDLNFLIPELVSRIDFTKGPYHAEEGDFSSAGSARMTLFDRLPRGLASLTVGPNQYTRALMANSTAAGGGNLLYALDLKYNNGPWDNPERNRKINGLLRYSEGTANHGSSLTLMAYSARWNSTDQIPLRAVSAGTLGRYAAVDPTDGGESSRYSLSYALRTPNRAGLLEFNAYAIRSSLDLYSNFTYFLNDPVNGDQFQQKERRDLAGFDLRQTFAAKLAGVSTLNQVGLQARFDSVSPLALYQTTARAQTAVTREDRVKQGSLGVFAENTTQWLTRFRTVAGVRHDSYSFDVSNSLAANSGNRSAEITSPKLSLIFGPWAQTEYFVNFGEGFHSNDARGTTTTIAPGTGAALLPVTPLVKTRGREIGVRSDLVPGLRTSFSLWQLDLASELVFTGDAGDTVASRPSHRQGAEWTASYVFGGIFALNADIAVSRARYTAADPSGDYIPGSIGRVAAVGASLINYRDWFGSVQFRYFGPRPLVEDDSVRSASTALTNLRVGYKLDARTRIVADVFNLFNRKASDIDYFYASQLRGEAAPVNDIHFHPVEPRTVRMTLTHAF